MTKIIDNRSAWHVHRFAGWLRGISLLMVLGAVAYAVPPVWASAPFLAVTDGLVSVTFLATAILLADNAEQQGNAWLFWLTSLLWTTGYIAYSQEIDYAGDALLGPLAVVQYTIGPLCFAALATVLLRYPETRLDERVERSYIRISIGLVILLRAASVAVSEPTGHGFSASTFWPSIASLPELDSLIGGIFTAVSLLLAVSFAALLLRRFRRAKGIDRRLLRPVIVTAAAVGTVVAAEVVSHLLPGASKFVYAVYTVEALALLAVPTAFLVAAIRTRLSNAAVAELVLQLSRPVTTTRVRDALSELLNDPSLDVAYWLPDYDAFFDTDGKRSPASDQIAERFIKYVNASNGAPLARISVDPSLKRYLSLVDAAVSAVGLALENGQLHAELRAQLQEVRASRARIVVAGDTERRRLERNLHDGAQQRLLALKLELAAARTEMQAPQERELIDRTRAELQETLDELRALARGLHPAILTQSGLAVAIRSVATRLPLSIEIDISPERWAAPIEATAYYVVCESLSNAAKHAKADRAFVSIAKRERFVELEIVDDGTGGAHVMAGGGLLGLQDRVAAIGGELVVTSPSGGGTCIRASIPCA